MSTSILEAVVKYLLNTKDVSTCVDLLMNLQKNLHNSQILEIGGSKKKFSFGIFENFSRKLIFFLDPIDTFLRQCVFLLPVEVHSDLLNQLSSKVNIDRY